MRVENTANKQTYSSTSTSRSNVATTTLPLREAPLRVQLAGAVSSVALGHEAGGDGAQRLERIFQCRVSATGRAQSLGVKKMPPLLGAGPQVAKCRAFFDSPSSLSWNGNENSENSPLAADATSFFSEQSHKLRNVARVLRQPELNCLGKEMKTLLSQAAEGAKNYRSLCPSSLSLSR